MPGVIRIGKLLGVPAAKGTGIPKPEMNKTEASYAEHLEARKLAGDVAWYRFEGVALKLAKDLRYTPDFLVMLANGELECHEVKGFWRDDARVKIKMAAAIFPFRFLAATKAANWWTFETFP